MAKQKRSKGSLRAKAGLPAKAGRRKQYGKPTYLADGTTLSGMRKQRNWGDLGKGYSMTHTIPEVTSNDTTKKYGERRLNASEVERRQTVLSLQYTEH